MSCSASPWSYIYTVYVLIDVLCSFHTERSQCGNSGTHSKEVIVNIKKHITNNKYTSINTSIVQVNYDVLSYTEQ